MSGWEIAGRAAVAVLGIRLLWSVIKADRPVGPAWGPDWKWLVVGFWATVASAFVLVAWAIG